MQASSHPAAPAPLPGTRTSCALLTLFTILLAWPSPELNLAIVVRPGYFALLYWYFRHIGRHSPELQGHAMQLIRSGFGVLWLGFTLSAVLHFAGLEPLHPAFAYLRDACERGALFLLGTSLLTFGLMLWIPQVLESHRVLGEHNARQRGELAVAETERSQLERRLVDADRRGLLGELAASVAHDLRNPLAIVKGTAESLCRRPRTPAEVAEHTEVIRRNIEKADQTIAALLTLGRPQATTRVVVPATTPLREVADLVQVELRRRRLQLAIVAAPGADEASVYVDRTLLAQALLNLLWNAIQATPADGHIALVARTWHSGGTARTALAVADDGVGIEPAVRPRLFTPFFTTKTTGTGLGLVSCRRIAKELGGDLRLYPRRRGGARAVLLLPANERATAAAPPLVAAEAAP